MICEILWISYMKDHSISGMDWEFGVSRCKLLHLKWISSEVLLYSTGTHIQCLGIEDDEREQEEAQ